MAQRDKIDRHEWVKEDAEEYRNPKSYGSKKYALDAVGPSVSGFYRLPAIWVAMDTSVEGRVEPQNKSSLEYISVLKMECGIVFALSPEGIFKYDFFEYPPAGQVFCPGYTFILDGKNRQPPKRTERARAKMPRVIEKRATIMNVHQLLLWSQVGNFEWPVSVGTDDVLNGNDLEKELSPGTAYSRGRYHTQGALRNEVKTGNFYTPRRTIGWNDIYPSLEMLDYVLLQKNDDLLNQLQEVFFATTQLNEGRFGIALIGFWAVIEQLLDKLWKETFKAIGFTGTRLDKMLSLNYTASIRIDTLQLMGIIPQNVYSDLEIARKGRNDWVHEMKNPNQSNFSSAISALRFLLGRWHPINLRLPSGSGESYGMTWIWHDARAMKKFTAENM